MRISQASNILATWAAVLTAIVTAYGFLQTYRDSVSKQVDDRHKQTFDLLRQFASKDFSPVREKALVVLRAAEKCQPVAFTAASMSETEAFTFVEFFDLVQACLDAQLCEPKLADQFFVPYASGHWLAFKGFVSSVRKGEGAPEKPFGYGLEKLGRAMRSFPSCPEPKR